MTPDHRIFKTAELSAVVHLSEHGKHGGRHITWPTGFRDAVVGERGFKTNNWEEIKGMSRRSSAKSSGATITTKKSPPLCSMPLKSENLRLLKICQDGVKDLATMYRAALAKLDALAYRLLQVA